LDFQKTQEKKNKEKAFDKQMGEKGARHFVEFLEAYPPCFISRPCHTLLRGRGKEKRKNQKRTHEKRRLNTKGRQLEAEFRARFQQGRF